MSNGYIEYLLKTVLTDINNSTEYIRTLEAKYNETSKELVEARNKLKEARELKQQLEMYRRHGEMPIPEMKEEPKETVDNVTPIAPKLSAKAKSKSED